MEQNYSTNWHFPIMIMVSFGLFFLIIRIVLGRQEFIDKVKNILILALILVVGGMVFAKYAAGWGFPWWIYYPIPMLMNVLAPPYILRMNLKKTAYYLLLSFMSAPIIHLLFSLILGWTEYMPFWKII